MKFYSALFAVLFTFVGVGGGYASAAPLVINPTSDGSLYVCSGCNTVSDGAYLMASGYIQGDVKFSTASIHAPITKALLSLNPYALPLWGTSVQIYGYGTAIGALDASDANAGDYLGTLVLPNLGFGEDVFFDVTDFMKTLSAPFAAFNLRTEPSGTDVFSSLEYNYGHPAQLTITESIPEPSTATLVLAAVLFVGSRRIKQKIS
jgi:hypothetical protein